MSASEVGRSFPVLIDRHDKAETPRFVPWKFLEEPALLARILRVHSQTLERLAERGGLGIAEIAWHLRGSKWGPDERFHAAESRPEVVLIVLEALARFERDALKLEHDRISVRLLGAERLADEVDALIVRRLVDTRSPVADALLDFRDPPRTPRSDRLGRADVFLVKAVARIRSLESSLPAVVACLRDAVKFCQLGPNSAALAAKLADEIAHELHEYQAQLVGEWIPADLPPSIRCPHDVDENEVVRCNLCDAERRRRS